MYLTDCQISRRITELHVSVMRLGHQTAELPLGCCCSCLDERLLHECLGFMELYLEKDAGKLAIHKFYLCMGAG